MTPISTWNVASLVDAHRRYLLGTLDSVDSTALGATAPLLLDERGWRPSGVVDVHLSLSAALDAFAAAVEAGTIPMRLNRSGGHERTVPQLMALLRRRWGLSHLPDAGARFSGEDAPPSPNTVAKWERDVISSATFLDSLTVSIRRRCGSVIAHAASATPRAPSTAADMPAAGLMQLMNQVRFTLGERHPLDEEQQILRHAATRRIAAYLSGADPRVFVHHSESTRSNWFRDDARYLDEFVRGRLDPNRRAAVTDERSQRREDAVVHLHLLLAAMPSSAKTLRQVAEEREASQNFVAIARDGQLTTALTLVRSGVPDPLPGLDTQPPSIGEIWQLAKEIRVNSGDACRYYFSRYITARVNMQDHLPAYTSESVQSVLLADQSVGRDAIDLEDAQLLSELERLRTFNTTSRARVYQSAFAFRDRAQIFGKQPASLSASLDEGVSGIRHVRDTEGDQTIDPATRLEAYEQLYLQNAGTAARVLEGMICSVPSRDELRRDANVYRQWMKAARYYADECMTLLGALDDADLLPSARYEESRVGSYVWNAQPRIIALRANLLCVILNEVLGRLDAPEVSALRRRTIDAYCELISHAAVGEANATALVQNAVLVAVVNGGVLPVRAQVAPALTIVPFLAGDENGELSGIRLDDEWIARASAFLKSRNYDRGPLAVMTPSSYPAARMDQLSGGIWSRWLTIGTTTMSSRFDVSFSSATPGARGHRAG
ncbi:hypothetical protein [Microbacterium foliorum]|uniref:hypothetical protein n=1 Tax=Microbacterium foliorum TaxID=104336 RepID=UPI0028D77AC1|nr:hypothetical protein [Microbacterium foliorum]